MSSLLGARVSFVADIVHHVKENGVWTRAAESISFPAIVKAKKGEDIVDLVRRAVTHAKDHCDNLPYNVEIRVVDWKAVHKKD